ncbi:MAG: sensor histidine kinase [Pyrinomonadaceae bacterium]
MKCAGKTLELEISDDGKGFSLTHPESKTGGFGLIGITERAELLGGRVEINSAPGQGTVIKIRLVNLK